MPPNTNAIHFCDKFFNVGLGSVASFFICILLGLGHFFLKHMLTWKVNKHLNAKMGMAKNPYLYFIKIVY